MRKIFGETMVDLAHENKKVVLITPDLEQEMSDFKLLFHNRFFNMGLCEQAIVSLAGGMARAGMYPFVYSITPFLLERAFEQIKIDIDEPCLPVTLVGYSGYAETDTTHNPLNGNLMASMFRNMFVYQPASGMALKWALATRILSTRPAFIFLTKLT